MSNVPQSNRSFGRELLFYYAQRISINGMMSLSRFTVSDSPAPEDLPENPVVLPSEYPDWGTTEPPPLAPDCGNMTAPDVRYAFTTK